MAPRILAFWFVVLSLLGSKPIALAAGGSVYAWGYNSFGECNVPAGLTNAVDVACGNYFSMALRDNGTITTWGDNLFGLRNVPAVATDVVAIDTKGYYALALRRDGTLVMWGSQSSIAPEATNIVAIAPGGSHTLALREDGELLAWGANNIGQCNIPLEATNVVAIAAGFTHSVALRKDGKVLVWGENIGGITNVPAGATNIVAIASGPNFILALRDDDQILAWGLDGGGNTSVPATATNVVAVAAGQLPDFAILADGSVVAWGRNDNGQLNVPGGLAPAFFIGAGEIHSLGIRVTGAPSFWRQPKSRLSPAGSSVLFSAPAVGQVPLCYQWRKNGVPLTNETSAVLLLPNVQNGNSGNYDLIATNNFGAVTSQLAAVTIQAAAPSFKRQPTSAAASLGGRARFEAWATGTDPLHYQWQKNGLDLPSATNGALYLTELTFADAAEYRVVVSNSYGAVTSTNATLEVAQVFAWGSNSSGLLNLPAGLSNVVSIAAGPAHNIALRADGSVVAWGDNGYNECSAIMAETNLVAVDAGNLFSLGLRRNGVVVAYGNTYIAPANATNIAAISAGINYSLMLGSNGVAMAWGDNYTPSPPASATNLVAIAAGRYHSLGLRKDGTVLGWGDNYYGQRVPPAGLSNVIAIAAGELFSLALRSDGTLLAWGGSNLGQTNIPPAATNILSIAAGTSHAMALGEDGQIFVWGNTNSGQALVPSALTFAAALSAADTHDLGLADAGPLRFTRQPLSQSTPAGVRIDLSGVAIGPGPVSYQWLHNGSAVEGATHAYLALANPQEQDVGDYRLIIANSYGAITSAVATVTVQPSPPVITQQPAGRLALPGSTVNFGVLASGTAPLFYQWFFNAAALPSATNNNLTFTNVQVVNAGDYQVILSNSLGSVTSIVAQLVVHPFNLTSVFSNASSSYSAAWGDFDRDGNMDTLIAGQSGPQGWVNTPVRLYRNLGDGTFSETNAGIAQAAQAAAWGDFDNDGFLDVLLTGYSVGNIWRNLGNGTFTNLGLSLAGEYSTPGTVVDFDNDGLLDVSMGGPLHRNLGNNQFTNANSGFIPLQGGAASWGDYNGDGFADVVLCGLSGGNARLRLYRNLGNGSFTNVNSGLPDLYRGMGVWLDYDGDGQLDVVVSGQTGPGVRTTDLYRNQGNGTFALVSSGLPATSYARMSVGDADNDGLPDLYLSGHNGTNYGGRLYYGLTNGWFTPDLSLFPSNIASLAAWGDSDQDGRLDLAIASTTTGPVVVGLYHNDATLTNTPPAAPSGGTAKSQVNGIRISWAPAADAQTPSPALTYNLRVGRTAGGSEVLAPQSLTNGQRLVPAPGNAGPNTAFPLTRVGFGRYYWSVQTIDSGLRGSEFSPEYSFVYAAITLPATNITSSQAVFNGRLDTNALPAVAYFEWGTTTNYSQHTTPLLLDTNASDTISAAIASLLPGTQYHYRLVLTNADDVYVGGDESFVTVDLAQISPQLATEITATGATLHTLVNPNRGATSVRFEFGLTQGYGNSTTWTNIGDGYQPVAVAQRVTGLLGGQVYHFRSAASNLAGMSYTADLTFTTTPEPEVATLSASGVGPVGAILNGTVRPNTLPTTAWFEYGLTTNYDNATAPQSLGSGTSLLTLSVPIINLTRVTTYHFRVVASNSFAISYGGDRAFMTTNDVIALPASNIGMTNVTFNGLVSPNNLTNAVVFEYGFIGNSAASTPVIEMTGGTKLLPVSFTVGGLTPGSNYFFRVVATNSEGIRQSYNQFFQALPQFSPVNPGLSGASGGALVWGDFNRDGWLDMLLSYNLTTRLYRNLGNGTFAQASSGISSYTSPVMVCEDFNQDGKLDVVISGVTLGTGSTRLYLNNGTLFQYYNSGLPTIAFRSVVCRDFDRDGRPDLLLAGETNLVPLTVIYRNNGSGNFSPMTTNLPGYLDVTAASDDIDNNGWPDLFLTGRVGTPYASVFAMVLTNDGAGNFEVTSNVLDGVRLGFADWGDYDGDGYADLVYGGNGTNLGEILRLYHNNGNGSFSNATGTLPQFACEAALWGDYDNDGRVDLLIRGQKYYSSIVPPNSYSAVLRNNGDGSFNTWNFPLPELWSSTGGWADYDNDGRLDAVVAGNSRTGAQMLLYHNNNPSTNTLPTAPEGLLVSTNNDEIMLSWNTATDSQSPSNSLTYNLRLGITPGGGEIVNPLSASNGVRQVVARGKAGSLTTSTFSNLPPSQYFWSVQAVDGAFAGSPFALDSTFSIYGAPVVTTLGAINYSAFESNPQGLVVPNGLPTTLWFEWGYTTNLGTIIPSPNVTNDWNSHICGFALGGFAPEQIGYYRFVATNQLGTSVGDIVAFQTGMVPTSLYANALTNGSKLLQFSGSSGFPYRVLASTNLTDWISLGLASDMGANIFRFNDPANTNYPSRFYRITLP